MKYKVIFLILFVFVFCGTAAPDDCGPAPTDSPNSNKMQQAAKAKEAAESLHFSANAEIENITKRLQLTTNPEQIGFVLLLNEMGQPILYTSVKGKITSGSKRLTPPAKEWDVMSGNSANPLGPSPSDEGTWGESAPYIFFWTMSGQYIQWNGGYLYSDQPFRITLKPLVITQE